MSKVMTILALTGFLIVGVAITSILTRDSVPAATAEMSAAMRLPAANRVRKTDRLDTAAVASSTVAPASVAASPVALDPVEPVQAGDMTGPLRQAFASATPADLPEAGVAEPDAPTSAIAPTNAIAPTKPKPAAKPQPQKSYAVLSDAQIAGIKQRLKLSSSQEYYWPAVDVALRAVARKIQANRLSNPHVRGVPIDADCEEVQQLKSAAMPLLFQLRDDQKEEVRKLARIIGLEKVAQQI